MAITWQSINAPNFSDSAAFLDQGGDRLNQAFAGAQGILDDRQGIEDQNRAAGLKNQLNSLYAQGVQEVRDGSTLDQALARMTGTGAEQNLNPEQVNSLRDQLRTSYTAASQLGDGQNTAIGTFEQRHQNQLGSLEKEHQITLENERRNSMPNDWDAILEKHKASGDKGVGALVSSIPENILLNGENSAGGAELRENLTKWLRQDEFKDLPNGVIQEVLQNTGVTEGYWEGQQASPKIIKQNIREAAKEYKKFGDAKVKYGALENTLLGKRNTQQELWANEREALKNIYRKMNAKSL